MISLYFFLIVIFTIGLGNSIIIFADSDSKILYSNWILIINSLVAAGLSFYILIKSKNEIGESKENILLTIGLLFWFIANIIWAYYEVVLDIVSPVPSLADFFLLSAYGFLIYRLLIIRKKLKHSIDKKIMLLILSITGIFLAYILYLTLDLAETSNFRGMMLFIVTIAYPTLNSILTVLAITIMIGIRKNKSHHLVPWVCELIGFLAIVVGDSWFAIIVLTTFVEQLWISTLLLSAHYLLIAGGLMWYLRYSIKWKSKDLVFKIVAGMKKRKPRNKILFASISVISLIAFSGFFFINGFQNDDNNAALVKKKPMTGYSHLISSSADEDVNVNNIVSNAAAGVGGGEGKAENGKPQILKEFIVGAIIPYTGSYASMGKPVKVALEKAEYDVNQYFEKMNSSSRVNLIMGNSKTNWDDTLNAIKELYARGAKIIVGPATSTAVAAVKDFANENNIILISYSSTSPALSIKGDNLIRFIPDDVNQGKVIAKKMIDDGIKVVIPMWRGDIYGNELYKSTKYSFEKLGGKIEKGINYKPNTGKFATSLHRINFIMWNKDLGKLNGMVSEAITKYGRNEVGVFIVSYDEITPILIQASNYPSLGDVRWYGSDSIAQNHHITKNIDSALFSLQTNFSNPLYSINTTTPEIHELSEILEQQLHSGESIIYPAIAYDAFWVSSLSLDKNSTKEQHLGINNNNNNNNKTLSFKDIVLKTTETFNDSITGKISLNEAGDRIGESYDFWTVSKNPHKSGYFWQTDRFASLSPSTSNH
ncbi:MAG TPA: ABC transporter substrate-binding protein [Nitrososphaeraceae archaeon]|nr:ABC transporter substrate-binding protein [Nitrososphaeraceae archaeon]